MAAGQSLFVGKDEDRLGKMPAGYVLKPPFRPLLNDEAIEFLESIVQPDWYVFEYGSGASTLWFRGRVAHARSIESNQDWYDAVRDVDLERVIDVIFSPATCQEESEEYASRINAFENDTFDLVFIDGDARPWCIRYARAKVKPGGWMVVDDLQYSPVKGALHLLDDWELIAKFKGKVLGAADGLPRTNTTGFYRKPAQ